MNVTIRHRILKGFSANLYGQTVAIVIQLVGVPILLHAWGAQLYGEWLILFAIPAYLSITDLGFSQSAANDMTQQVARGERDEALVVFQSLSALVFSAAAAGLLLVSVVLFTLPLERWLHFSEMSVGQTRWVLWLLAAEVLVRLSEGVNHAGFRASGDYAFHIVLNTSTLLVQSVAIWIIAFVGGGPMSAATAYFCIRALVVPVSALIMTRRHPWLCFGFTHARPAELRRLAKPAVANLGLPIAQALNVQGLVLVVGAVLGPLAVVTFSTLRTLTRLTLRMVLAVGDAAEPELAAAYGTGNRRTLQNLFINTLRAGLWLALITAVSLAIFGSVILDVWTRGKVIMDATLFHWLLISAVASVTWHGALIVLKAANRHWRAAFLYSLSAGTAVALAGALLVLTGRLADAGLALLLMDIVMAIYTLRAACSTMGTSVMVCVEQAVNPFPILQFVMRKAHGH